MMQTLTRSRDRGMAAIAVIALMLLLSLVVLGMVHGTARDQNLTVNRVDTVQAFYAAEAGMNMALREMFNGADEDGDGTVGTISDDGNAANNPSIGSATVYVSQSVAAPVTTLNSFGSMGGARRHLEADTE